MRLVTLLRSSANEPVVRLTDRNSFFCLSGLILKPIEGPTA